jgi:adenylosuccinate lyase
MVVYEKVIASHVKSELPFMATENILMEAVNRGGDRQELHEIIRKLSMEAAKRVKEEGLNNDLLDRILKEKAFNLKPEELYLAVKAENYTGRASGQVVDFITESIKPILEENKNILGLNIEINV